MHQVLRVTKAIKDCLVFQVLKATQEIEVMLVNLDCLVILVNKLLKKTSKKIINE